MIINTESPDQPEVRAMLAQLDASHAELYPARSDHLPGVDALLRDDALFLVARDVDGSAVGCAALVNRHADGEHYGEVKRMFVDAARRRLGAGRELLEHLTMFARMAGIGILRLETGVHQSAALALYEHAGFVRRAPFGDGGDDPLSVFMEKRL